MSRPSSRWGLARLISEGASAGTLVKIKDIKVGQKVIYREYSGTDYEEGITNICSSKPKTSWRSSKIRKNQGDQIVMAKEIKFGNSARSTRWSRASIPSPIPSRSP
jgi:hypothetical protein